RTWLQAAGSADRIRSAGVPRREEPRGQERGLGQADPRDHPLGSPARNARGPRPEERGEARRGLQSCTTGGRTADPDGGEAALESSKGARLGSLVDPLRRAWAAPGGSARSPVGRCRPREWPPAGRAVPSALSGRAAAEERQDGHLTPPNRGAVLLHRRSATPPLLRASEACFARAAFGPDDARVHLSGGHTDRTAQCEP